MFIIFLLFSASKFVFSSDNALIPPDKSQLNYWFKQNVAPFASRKSMLDSALVTAEASPEVVKVRRDGRGNFTTISDAIKSIPAGNKKRVIVSIGPGRYWEKIMVDINKPFVTFYGDPESMPTLVFDGTATKYGTVSSATLFVYSDYFVGVNLRVVNSARRGAGQAVAMTIQGDMAAFYNCEFHGFQDTLCDNTGRHFYKDCYIEGTVDFIFGSGQSLFLNTTVHVIPGDRTTFITAQARGSSSRPNGYSLVHCTVTGTGRTAYLGRAWYPYGRVVFAYSKLSNVVNPEGWFNNRKPKNNKTVYFGEYENTGPGSDLVKRVQYTRELSDKAAVPFLKLAFIDASTWLLPPPKVNRSRMIHEQNA